MPITRRRRANPPDQPEDNNHSSDQPENIQETLASEQDPTTSLDGEHASAPSNEQAGNTFASPTSSQSQHQAGSNGDRNDRQDHSPAIEGGRRTARGELFRRPPQPPPQSMPTPLTASGSIQAPTHEISLTKHAACYYKTCLKKAKQVAVPVAGIVALLQLPMIVGTLVAKRLVKLVSLFAKSVVYGVSCDALQYIMSYNF